MGLGSTASASPSRGTPGDIPGNQTRYERGTLDGHQVFLVDIYYSLNVRLDNGLLFFSSGKWIFLIFSFLHAEKCIHRPELGFFGSSSGVHGWTADEGCQDKL